MPRTHLNGRAISQAYQRPFPFLDDKDPGYQAPLHRCLSLWLCEKCLFCCGTMLGSVFTGEIIRALHTQLLPCTCSSPWLILMLLSKSMRWNLSPSSQCWTVDSLDGHTFSSPYYLRTHSSAASPGPCTPLLLSRFRRSSLSFFLISCLYSPWASLTGMQILALWVNAQEWHSQIIW